MGPPLNSGGDSALRAPRSGAPSFNGAAAEQRRRRRSSRAIRADSRGFNGAAAEQRRRLGALQKAMAAVEALQWGRR